MRRRQIGHAALDAGVRSGGRSGMRLHSRRKAGRFGNGEGQFTFRRALHPTTMCRKTHEGKSGKGEGRKAETKERDVAAPRSARPAAASC